MERILKCEPGQYLLSGSDTILSQRYNMTYQYLTAMKLLLKAAHQIEQAHLGEPCGEFFTDIRAYISTVIILAGALLEANIYERFVDVKDGDLVITGFNLEALKKEWGIIERSSNTLCKYRNFTFRSGAVLDVNDLHYKEVRNLVKIRNALVHYVPIRFYGKALTTSIEKRFSEISTLVEYSPFVPATQPYFPMRCMSAGFGQWAINTSLDFVKYFEEKLQIGNKCEALRTELQIVRPRPY